MTNEEIIKGLQAVNEHIGKHFNEGGAWMAEFIDNAIQALEQQMIPRKNHETTSKDCISREEAKKLIQGKIDDIPQNKDGTYGSMFSQYVNGLYCAKTAISYMPSVAPQRPKGKWILIHPLQKEDDGAYICSNCEHGDWDCDTSYKYCPNCGADMRNED